jgi:hypothetical protein
MQDNRPKNRQSGLYEKSTQGLHWYQEWIQD